MKKTLQYCNSLIKYDRRVSRPVSIGDVALGGDNPIRIQSMTTTNTMDTDATVEQSVRMIHAGCEYVRITAPSNNEAKNLEKIKRRLRAMGYNTPLIADIHFTPKAAEIAARIVEKVRVNPGNFADKKRFNYIEYTDSQYSEEIDRIRSRLMPLIQACKEYGTAMRIGTNHGSLSDRILSRYGDTPLGMVESALEFIRICSDEGYHDIVLSMKSSNPIVMVQAYRLLVNRMDYEGMDYPLHLGVTEAGEGDDGRIKSAVGIGALLEDGLGDTVRVSLTEEPEFEISPAYLLSSRYSDRKASSIPLINNNPVNPFEFSKRETLSVMNIGGDNPPRVVADFSDKKEILINDIEMVGYRYFKTDDKWGISDQACDYIYVGSKSVEFNIPGTLRIIQDYVEWKKTRDNKYCPIMNTGEYLDSDLDKSVDKFLLVNSFMLDSTLIKRICSDSNVVLVIETESSCGMQDQRRMFMRLMNNSCSVPVIVKRSYKNRSYESLQLYSSTDIGGLFIDGLGDGIFIEQSLDCGQDKINSLSFGILQAARARISKTEYISCPSCGRTLFDLQETTARIRARTDHLKGIKIGVMGCIVNGPGEMADADYGYVGTGNGIISLYKGQDVVKSNIPTEQAVDELILLIAENGDWIEPEEPAKNT